MVVPGPPLGYKLDSQFPKLLTRSTTGLQVRMYVYIYIHMNVCMYECKHIPTYIQIASKSQTFKMTLKTIVFVKILLRMKCILIYLCMYFFVYKYIKLYSDRVCLFKSFLTSKTVDLHKIFGNLRPITSPIMADI